MRTHVEPVMGTIVGITSTAELPAAGLAAALEALHEADRVFSTWNPASPLSRLRSGRARLEDLDPADAELIYEVLGRCAVARQLSGGAFDPWAMPGGVDPTGLVKGWAAARSLRALAGAGAADVMVNAGGDIAVTGGPWRIGVRHPSAPDQLAAIVEVGGAIATSADYERHGQLVDPRSGRPAAAVASATVTGPDLDLADALATALAVAGPELLPEIDRIPGYGAFVIALDGRRFATSGLRFAD